MALSSVEHSLLVAAFYRGGKAPDGRWVSNSDQIITLSLFYTGDISFDECVVRFSTRSYISSLYDANGDLTEEIAKRYTLLITLLREHPELIKGGGDFEWPAHPTYTSCALTDAGADLAVTLIPTFPLKPEFPNWPDKRTALGP